MKRLILQNVILQFIKMEFKLEIKILMKMINFTFEL